MFVSRIAKSCTTMKVRLQDRSWIRAGIFKQSMGARNRVGIGLSYRLARLHRLAESIPGLLKCLKIRALDSLLGFTNTAIGTEKNVPENLYLYVQRVV